MREIHVDTIIKSVEELCINANYYLPDDVTKKLEQSVEEEVSPLGKEILRDILKNVEIAKCDHVPICQDTGFAVFFVEIGQDARIVGGDFNEAVNQGVRQGYKNGYLRKSVVMDPIFTRKNTGDNTPAIIHTTIVPGDKIKIAIAPKGGGSENMSALRMLKPSDGVEGIKKFVLETVENAGPNPCPPIVLGIGIGGTIDLTTLLAKKALLRELGVPNPDPKVAQLEKELLGSINKLGIGPQGFGGRITALGVNIETFPAHITALPVAINFQCHVSRHKEIVL